MRAFGPSATSPRSSLRWASRSWRPFALVQVGPAAAIVIGGLPLALLAAAGLLSHGRVILLGAALGLPLSGIAFLRTADRAAGDEHLHPGHHHRARPGSWAVAALVARERGDGATGAAHAWSSAGRSCSSRAAIVIATLRGHYAYGATLFGQPLRLVLYAGIVVTLAGLTARQLYRLLLWLFYTGTGRDDAGRPLLHRHAARRRPDQLALSTGGSRVLGISTTHLLRGRAVPGAPEPARHPAVGSASSISSWRCSRRSASPWASGAPSTRRSPWSASSSCSRLARSGTRCLWCCRWLCRS